MYSLYCTCPREELRMAQKGLYSEYRMSPRRPCSNGLVPRVTLLGVRTFRVWVIVDPSVIESIPLKGTMWQLCLLFSLSLTPRWLMCCSDRSNGAMWPWSDGATWPCTWAKCFLYMLTALSTFYSAGQLINIHKFQKVRDFLKMGELLAPISENFKWSFYFETMSEDL